MEILHLNSYQLTLEEEDLLEIEELKTFILSNEIQSIDKSSIPEKFADIFDKYESYRNETRNRAHGKIAQFWFAAVQMFQLYHQFIRSIKMGDVDHAFTVYIIFPVYSLLSTTTIMHDGWWFITIIS